MDISRGRDLDSEHRAYRDDDEAAQESNGQERHRANSASKAAVLEAGVRNEDNRKGLRRARYYDCVCLWHRNSSFPEDWIRFDRI